MKGPSVKFFSDIQNEYGTGSNFCLNFYQKWISPVKGGNKCPMHPSCSQYSKILFQHLPLHKAYIGTFERLLRCGQELYLYKTLRINGLLRWYDPPNIAEEIFNNRTNIMGLYINQNAHYSPPNKNLLYQESIANNGFADYLFDNGEYYRAITEYMRLQYLSSDSYQTIGYLRKIGLCYYLGADYDGFINYLEQNRKRLGQVPIIKEEMELFLGKTYFHLKNYSKAITTIQWSGIKPADPLYNEMQFMLGLSYAKIFHWEEACLHMTKVDSLSQRGKIAKTMSRSLVKGGDLPNCHPWLAGTLSSAIPGSGYLYARRKGTALASFFINSLILWTLRDAIRQNNYGFATTLGFFGMGWYIGNIKGSIDAAKKFNSNTQNQFIDSFLENVDIDYIQVN